MDFIQRKVILTKNLVPYDSNNDGHYDSLTISATTKSIIIPLTTSYDDMGIFEVDDEDIIDIINIGNFFDDKIDGKDVPQPNDPVDPSSNDWGSGSNTGQGSAGEPYDYQYCGDPQSPSYQSIQSIGLYFGIPNANTKSDSQIITELTALNITLVITNSLCGGNSSGASGAAEEQGGYFVDAPKFLWSTETVPGNSGNSHCHSGGGTCRDYLNAKNGGYYCKCGCETETSPLKNWTPYNWSTYDNTAYQKAAVFCSSIGKQIIPVNISTLTNPQLQGSPANYGNDGMAWPGVKLVQTKTQQCCPNWVDYRPPINQYNTNNGTSISVASIGWCPGTPLSARQNNHCCGANNSSGNLSTAYNYQFGFFCIN